MERETLQYGRVVKREREENGGKGRKEMGKVKEVMVNVMVLEKGEGKRRGKEGKTGNGKSGTQKKEKGEGGEGERK